MNEEVRDIWNANAEFWDSKMGEGNDFHKMLIEPIQLKLLNIKAGDKILDIACGNGQFARKMAELGANVTAIDFSDKFIAIAKSKGKYDIKYQVIDVTCKTDLKKLAVNNFDSIVCTMALMDMENIKILINHLPKMLKRDGIFVFSILHPCFNSGENILVHERDELGGEVKSRYSVKIRDYLIEKSSLGIGMIGQPRPQYYFHRPVSTILKYFFKNGFVLDAYEEPSFANIENPTSIYGNVYKHIPPALICRLRIPS
ncbi:MAG: class I SAM-dependent DNA methyltransferase [Candidatus Hodarchaeota archaeon]